MRTSLGSERRLLQYLLGRMPERKRVDLEERLFADEDLDEELLATADDLIHSYLSGALSADDRLRFETYFLASPDHRERFTFIADLLSAVRRTFENSAETSAAASPRPAPRAWGRWAVAMAAVLGAIGALILLTRQPVGQRTRQTTTGPRPIESARPSPHASPESPQPEAARPEGVRVVRLPRDVGTPVRVLLSPDTRVVRVEVAVDEGSPSFGAAVRTADGREVWRAEGLAPPASGERLVVTIPARVFASDRYSLRVEGEPLREEVTPVLEYHLRVARQR